MTSKDLTVWIAIFQVDGYDVPKELGVYASESLAWAACEGDWKRTNPGVEFRRDWYGVMEERVRRSVAY